MAFVRNNFYVSSLEYELYLGWLIARDPQVMVNRYEQN